MDQELVDIVLHKSFVELSANERKDLLEWCSGEEEFNQMKNVFIEVELMKKQQTETARPETKKSLDALFVEKHKRGGSIIWNSSLVTAMYPVEKPFHRRPLVQIVALALLLLLSYPMLQNSKTFSESPQLAKNEPIIGSKKKEKSIVPVVKEEILETDSENKVECNSTSMNQISNVEIQKMNNKQIAVNSGFSSTSVTASTLNSSDFSATSIGVATYSYTTSAPPSSTISNNWTSGLAVTNVETTQPDGLYEGDENTIQYSQAVSENSSVLDLLTVTF